MIGQTILQYKILTKLGEGGMGVVFKAEDTKLKREVALKFLPTNALQSPGEKDRFLREAQASASFTHSNIALIYAIEEVDDQVFIAMEFIEGQSLSDIVGASRPDGTPLPLDKAINYASQIAAGLQAAQEKNITHRDVKSANIMVDSKGVVKIMDFGLAKLANRSMMTQEGATLGTAAYMSPEQARGEKVDHRSDIWSLGVVLYEMISGQLPFKGDYEQAVIYSILNEEPEPLTALRSGLPIALDGIIAKAMAKDPSVRYQHVDELPADLKGIETASVVHSRISTAAKPSESRLTRDSGGSRLRKSLPWLVAVVTTIGFIFTLTLILQQGNKTNQKTERLNISVLNSPTHQVYRSDIPAIAISPDGSKLAYCVSEEGVTKLYVRQMNSFAPTPINGTDNAAAPFFSPDGQWIGFLADGKLKKVAVAGGAPETIYDAPAFRGASWGSDDMIIFSPEFSIGLRSMKSSGGEVQVVSRLDTMRDERTHRWPQVLPGGEWVLYTIGDQNRPNSYINAELAIQSLKTGERHILNIRGEMVRYVEPGYLIIARNGVLLAAPFSLETFKITEAPQLVVSNVAGDLGSGISYFDISGSGKLVFIPGTINEELELVWVDRMGQIESLPFPKKPYSTPRISPDGKKLAVTSGLVYGTNSDIWIYDLTSNVTSRFTFEQGMWAPVWSKDSKHLFFTSGVVDKRGVMVKPIDGSRAEELIIPVGSETMYPVSISPDGTHLILNSQTGRTSGDIYILNLEKKDKPKPLFESNHGEYYGSISPDGKFLAYASNETGRFEIFVYSYPDLTGRWQVSTESGNDPIWSIDGKELYYYTNQGKLMSVAIQTQPVFSLGKSVELFDVNQMYFPNIGAINYDISPDGQRFLMIGDTSFNPNPTAFNVILNWVEELEERFSKNE